MNEADSDRIAVIGGGPAGLMAAETLLGAGRSVDLYDGLASVGRKILIAGKGGLNLTHSEPFEPFVARYRERRDEVRRWLLGFDAEALRSWARGLGVETIVGSSGRVFPADLKAAPLLRGWVRRLREQGLRFHTQQRWLGWATAGDLRFAGGQSVRPAATLLALGGASWPKLGSDGGWVPWLRSRGVDVAELKPANCGFETAWSEHFRERFAGQPVKPVAIAIVGGGGGEHLVTPFAAEAAPTGEADSGAHGSAFLQGEFVITEHGIEGSLVYALSAALREAIANHGEVDIRLDLAPGRTQQSLHTALSQPRGKRSLSEFMRRQVGIDGVRLGLLYERLGRTLLADPAALAAAIKSLPLSLSATRPIAEAISSAGGVRFAALDDALMLRALPGVFCAGEMIDWEAPTGGYLLTACMASGRHAALGLLDWLGQRDKLAG
jgi:uncharacterized flavoprotein (TIGR03862 family)